MHDTEPIAGALRQIAAADEPPATNLLNCNLENGDTPEVGTYPPGVNSLHDMLGKVSEWTADCYDESYYTHSLKRNPIGPI